MIGDGDLELIFESGDFDTVAEFTISVGVTREVNGWFTEGSDATLLYGVQIEAVEPTFTCPSDEITAVQNKMAVVINAATYTVQRKQQIGTGVSVCYLKTT